MQVYLQFEISPLCLSPSLRFMQNSIVLWAREAPAVQTACQQSPLSLARAPHFEPLMTLHRYEF